MESAQRNWEQEMRQNNLEISCVPTAQVDLMLLIKKCGNAAKINIEECDIDYVYRATVTTPVGVRAGTNNRQQPPRPPAIIVRFTTRRKKDQLLAGLREIRETKRGPITTADIGLDFPAQKIYFNDHLTMSNKILYKKVRDIAKQKKYRFVWLKNCRIYVREKENSAVIKIYSEEDLAKIN